jgi:tricorn protease
MTRITQIFLWLCLWLPFVAVSQQEALWLRYPAISPDGSTILFSYKGDLYKVPSTGGLAYPITLHEAYERNPVWSADGEQVAFASNRYGNFDVFLMSVNGGSAQRLTYHSSGDYPSDFSSDDSAVLFSSSRLDAASNRQFPSGVLPELYEISTQGGMPRQLLTTPALSAKYSKNDKRLLYHDRKGYEDDFRKHHESSVTRDIWMYEDGKYTQLSTFEGEDRSPVFAPDEQGMYFLSEENGDFNIFYQSFGPKPQKRQLTFFENHPVRYLSISNTGTLCFTYHGAIYTMVEGQQPQKLSIQVATGERYNENELHKVTGKASELQLSPNGKELAFVYRGEVFVTSIEGGTTRQITQTPQQERSVSFSPDGRTLLYASEREGSWGVYQSTLQREEEDYFFNATLIEEQAIIQTEKEEFQPAFSPDGEEVAYLEERTILKVYNIKTRQSRTILGADKNYSYSDGDQYYQWSPDGKWFLVEFLPPEQWLSQAGLISASGEESVINLTNSGYGAGRPKWMMDGKMMLWFSSLDGMRNHSNRGSETDAYGMFFTQDAYDKFRLDEEEYKLLKEEEEDQKEEDEKEEDEKKKTEDLKLELEDIENRKVRLSIHSSRMADAYVDKKGEHLYYLAKFEKGYNLWKTDLKSKETKMLAKLNCKAAGQLIVEPKEKHVFLIADGSIKKIALSSGDVEQVSIKGEMQLHKEEERLYQFEHIWRQVDKKFYKKDLHNVDWAFYKEEYAPFLPHIDNGMDFADMLSEMLGELNASHTGASYRNPAQDGDKTAALGVFYDYTYNGPGLKIEEVIAKGPLEKKGSKVKEGHIIEKIDGQVIDASQNLFHLLNRKAGKNTLLSFRDPNTGERWEETIKPITLGEEGQLKYQRWVKNCRAIVDELSDGQVGYVHVRSMNDKSFRTVYDEVLGKNNSKMKLFKVL